MEQEQQCLCLFISGKRKRLKEMQGSDIAHGCMTHPCLVQAALCPWHRWGATGAGGDCHGLICTAQCESHWEEECHPPSPCPFTVVLGTEGRCWMWVRSPKWELKGYGLEKHLMLQRGREGISVSKCAEADVMELMAEGEDTSRWGNQSWRWLAGV